MNNNELDRIHYLIDRYFEGETSLAQEQELRRLVATQSESADPAIREARAVLGYFAEGRHADEQPMEEQPTEKLYVGKRTGRFIHVSRIAGIAAAIAVVAIIGVKLHGLGSATSDCYTYVGSRCITDRDAVEAAIFSDLKAVSEASENVEDEITDDINLLHEALQSTISQ